MEEYLSIFPDSKAHDKVKENLDFLRPHVSLLEDSGTVVYDKKIIYDELPEPRNLSEN